MEKCSKQFKKILKQIDYFGTFVTFRVNDEIEYKSLIGGTFTLIYGIFAFIFIMSSSISFLKRENLDFIYSHKIMSQPFINLSYISFTFAFGIQYSDNASSAVEDTYLYFNYSIKLIEWVGKNDIYEKNLEFRKCESSDFPKLEGDFYMNDLNEMLCPIYDHSTNFSIDGLYTDDYYKFISIQLKLTDYAFENYSQLKLFLNKTPIDVAIFFRDTTIDYENRKKPLPPYLNYNYKGVDLDFIKKTSISISSLEFISDENFFTYNSKLTKETMFSSSQDSFRYIKQRQEENEYQIFEYLIEASPKVVYLKRVYQKLPEFVASISGILGFVCLIMVLIANLIEMKAIDQKLIHRMLKFRGNKNIDVNYFAQKFNNKLKNDIPKFKKEKFYSDNLKVTEDFFEINNNSTNDNIEKNSITEGINIINSERIPHKISDKENMKIKKKVKFDNEDINRLKHKCIKSNLRQEFQRKNKRMKTIDLEKEVFESLDMKEINQTEIINQTPESKKDQEDLVKLNIIQIIYTVLCSFCSKKSSKKYKLLKSAEKKIHYYMDIITYIKTVQEFELLKEMLFNENFLRLFQFVSKPTMKILIDDFVFCHHFEREYIPFKKIGKNEIDSLYTNYKEVLLQEKSIEKLKLLNFIKGEIEFLEN